MPTSDSLTREGLSIILEAVPMPIIVASTEGQIWESNSPAATFLGYSPKQLCDLQTQNILKIGEKGEASFALNKTGSSLPIRLDRKVSVINQTAIEVFTLLPVEQSSNPNLILDDMRLELLRNKEDIQSFLAVASHDLKSPLRRTKSFIDLISKNYADLFDEKGEDWLSRCSNNLSQMQSLIDDLAAFAGINAEPLRRANCSLQDLVTEAFAKLKETRFPKAELDFTAPLPTVSGDARLLGLLFENLFDNALTYNENQVPSLIISCTLKNEMWEMSIQDNGIGIEEKHREVVFDSFKRLHPSSRFPGNGLGLAISQRIAKHHQGDLSLSVNQPRQGSVFLFALPAL